MIEKWPIEIVRLLVYFKDLQGRVAIDSATKNIRAALEKRILFLGRFELVEGPVLHKSPTSVVIKATDRGAEDECRKAFKDVLKKEEPPNDQRSSVGKVGFKSLLQKLGIRSEEKSLNDQHSSVGKVGFKSLLQKLGIRSEEKSLTEELFEKWDSDNDGRISEEECVKMCKSVRDNGRPREVVLKFMRNREQFQREIESRKLDFDSKYVIGIIHYYSHDTHEAFAGALKLFSNHGDVALGDYKHLVVMPLADRNLDTIFRSERPDKVNNRLRIKDQELADENSRLTDRLTDALGRAENDNRPTVKSQSVAECCAIS
jgi:Ca2+-binding EF-hand superfamily protein